MFTKITTIEELKEMFTEIMLNKTDKISKASDGSVNNAIAFGNAKMAQKIQKDTAILESHLFPDSAYGKYLDDIARLNGISQRFGAKQSSTYIRIVGTPYTTYLPGTHVFSSTTGIDFELEKTTIIPTFGYTYAKVRSTTTGSSTNVDALTINKVSSPPDGHQYCINEYAAQYGSDVETDEFFRKRIKEGVNLLSRGTISTIEQVFMKINENVLKVFNGGFDGNSRVILTVLTQNGIDLNQSEIDDILVKSEKFLSLCDMRPTGIHGSNVAIQNAQWQPVDLSMRLDLQANYTADEVRKDIQIRISKYLDYRYWKLGQRVEWDNILEIVKQTAGVRYVNDFYFFPNRDIEIDNKKLPRIRGFQMLDLNGNIIQDLQGNLNQFYYPNQIDFSYQASVLKTI